MSNKPNFSTRAVGFPCQYQGILHVEANRVWKEFGQRRWDVFVTDWVIAETGNGLARGHCRDLFAQEA